MIEENASSRVGIGWSLLAIGVIAVVAMLGRGLSEALPNVAPIAAAALLAGYVVGRRLGRPLLAMAVPMLAMLISDVLWFGTYELGVMATVYAAFLACALLGRFMKRASWWRVGGLSLIGSGLFFVSTNLAVWAFTPWYPQTAAGLAACFTAALPFLKYTVLGDLFFAGMMFGGYAIVCRTIEVSRTASLDVPQVQARMAA